MSRISTFTNEHLASVSSSMGFVVPDTGRLLHFPDPVTHPELKYGKVGQMYEYRSVIRINPETDSIPTLNRLAVRY